MDLFPRARGFGLLASSGCEDGPMAAASIVSWDLVAVVTVVTVVTRVVGTSEKVVSVLLARRFGECSGDFGDFGVSFGATVAGGRRDWSDVVSRLSGAWGGVDGVGPCCSGWGPLSPCGRVCGWRLASVRAVVSCIGVWCPESFPLCFFILGEHPGVVFGALSSADRFWPARLLSSRQGGGELSAGGGVGTVAGGSRGRVGRVPEEQPSAAGLGWAAQEWSSAGLFVGLSDGGWKCGV